MPRSPRLLPRRSRLALCLLVALALTACSSPASFSAGRIGANVGSAQDIGYTRQQIATGSVPPATGLTAGGLYAEHDLPLGEAPAGKTLHLTLGLGIAPLPGQEAPSHFVQIGLGSGLSAESFKRAPLDLVVVADRSGSMAGANIAALREALRLLVYRLTPRDRLAIVAFDDQVDVFEPLRAVDDRDAFGPAIDRFTERGGTDIEAGLEQGYKMLERKEPGRERRVLLITDALPNVGATGAASFESLVSRYAAQGIGLTAMGVGLDFGAELTDAIGSQKGGNYVFLEDSEKLRRVFDLDFDYLVSPAAYDVELDIQPAEGFAIAEAYGTRQIEANQTGYTLKIPTLFFSRNRGAIVLRLEPKTPDAVLEAGQAVAKGQLRYTEPDGVTKREDTIEAVAPETTPSETSERFVPAVMQKTTALTQQYVAMKEALRLHAEAPEGREEAIALLTEAEKSLTAARDALADPALDKEIALVARLKLNMQKTVLPDNVATYTDDPRVHP